MVKIFNYYYCSLHDLLRVVYEVILKCDVCLVEGWPSNNIAQQRGVYMLMTIALLGSFTSTVMIDPCVRL